MSHHISIFDVEGLRHCFPRTGLLFDSLIKSMLDVSHPFKVGRCGRTILWSISAGSAIKYGHAQLPAITYSISFSLFACAAKMSEYWYCLHNFEIKMWHSGDILYLILASQPLQVLNSTFKPGKMFMENGLCMRANSLQFLFSSPGDCEESCQVSRVRGDDDESKQPPFHYHLYHIKQPQN